MSPLKLITVMLSAAVLSACGGATIVPEGPTDAGSELTPSSIASSVIATTSAPLVLSSSTSSNVIQSSSKVSSSSAKSSSTISGNCVLSCSSESVASATPSSAIINSSVVSSSVVSSSIVSGEKWVFRGSPNTWGKTPLVQSGNTFTICQKFAEPESAFKISNDSKGEWVEAYPANNVIVDQNFSYDISFNSTTHAVVATKRASDCGVAAPSSVSNSSSAVSTSSNVGVGSSSSGNVNVNADVKTASGTLDSRLACYKNAGEKACDLRTYQVMVESFVDGDGAVNMNAGYGTSHHKGDIQGVINSLDYIKSLGVNTIWLTPVFDSNGGNSPSKLDATGYFASNFFNVDPHFGSKQKLKDLVDQAHAKGLYVLLDGVFGHSKSDSGNFASPTGKKIIWKSDALAYPENLEFFKEVATYWVKEYKIDGWRLDQAYQVPVQYWAEIRSAVEATSASVTYENAAGQMVKPLGYMVGEIWKGESEIKSQGYGAAGSAGLLSAFDFPLRYSLVQTLAVEESGTGKKAASNLNTGYATHKAYPDHAMPNLMLTNHDLVRFGDLIQRGGIANPSDDQYWLRHKAAISFMAAYSGPITLYYGDEIGQEVANFAAKVDGDCSSQGKCDDHVSRDSGVVEGVTGTNVLSPKQVDLKNYVASLMVLRDAHPALWNGSRTHIYSNANVYIDRKIAGNDRILYALNTSNAEVKISVAAAAIGASGDLKDLLSSTVYENNAGVYYLVLAPFQGAFLSIN